jgi:acyl-coenzyme A thioesterase PaaI-like protein
MEAIKSILIWPIITLISYIRFTIGVCFCIPSCLLLLLNKNRRELSTHDNLFKFMNNIPLGNYVFSGLIGFFAPYSASINLYVLSFEKDRCIATIEDYPWLKSPFSSIHAIALANLGECVSGMCMLTNLQYKDNLLGIPTRIDTVYYHKARGRITGTGRANICDIDKDCEINAIAEMHDSTGLLVAKTTVTWTITRKKKID